MNGNWELMPYTAWHSIKAVANCHAKTMIKFTSFFEKRSSKKQTMNYRGGDGSNSGNSCNSKNISKVVSKKVTPTKRKVKDKETKVKEPKVKEPKVKAPAKVKEPKIKANNTKTTDKDEITTEIQEKPKIVRRKKVKLIVEE
jgi:hypothetical protein